MSDNIKYYEAPLKEDWDRREFFEAQKKLAHMQQTDFSPFVFCYNCKKNIESRVLHVINFGKWVACDQCYSKKGWAKRRNTTAKFPIPGAIEESFLDFDEIERLRKLHRKKIQADVDKAVDMARKHCEELKAKFANATFGP